jgi:hypothetical protein
MAKTASDELFRSQAAQKAATTRKRQAAERRAAARKGARTRARAH